MQRSVVNKGSHDIFSNVPIIGRLQCRAWQFFFFLWLLHFYWWRSKNDCGLHNWQLPLIKEVSVSDSLNIFIAYCDVLNKDVSHTVCVCACPSPGPDCLKTKMSELRLYCDLLVQQVQTIQSQHSDDTEAAPTSEVTPHCFCHIRVFDSIFL